MKTISIHWLTASCCLLFAVSAKGQDDLPVVKPEVKTLAAFKNGLGFVFKAGNVKLKDGWARLDDLPPAALGSLWIGTTTKGATVSDVISYKQQVSETSEAITLPELLTANVGRRVALTYSVANTLLRAEGVLVSVPADRKPDETALPPAASDTYGTIRSPSESFRGEMVLIRTGTGDRPPLLAVNKSAIQSVDLLEGQELSTKLERQRSRVKLRAGTGSGSAEITLAYLEKGIVWSPSYRVNLADESNAEISLDAVLASDNENLTNADVSFVVGYPNFLYADMLSPLSVRQSVAGFVQSLLSGTRNNANYQFANANVMAQSITYNTAAYDASARAENLYSAGQPLPGEGNEDLYFYKKSGVTLNKGDRARFEVFAASVPCEHLYQWEVTDDQSVDDRGYRRNPGNSTPAPENQVWHVLRLQNKTKQPWTTAPAFTMNGTMPVAQDILGYTPAGGKSTLKLTVATDLRGEASQTEVQRRNMNSEGYSVDEITVAGKLKITSFKAGEVSVVVRKSVTGEVLEAGDGKITKVARALSAINPNSQIEWEFHLPPGKDQELTYQYKVLMRR